MVNSEISASSVKLFTKKTAITVISYSDWYYICPIIKIG
jgi:hypothetical protein